MGTIPYYRVLMHATTVRRVRRSLPPVPKRGRRPQWASDLRDLASCDGEIDVMVSKVGAVSTGQLLGWWEHRFCAGKSKSRPVTHSFCVGGMGETARESPS